MPYNSLVFVTFFAGVYSLYLLLGRSHRAQNVLLLAASYFFYGYWDWRFLGLIALTTVVDYTVGLQLDKHKAPRQRRRWLLLSLTVDLGVLGVFKYFNFFAASAAQLLSQFGMQSDPITLNLLLPIGISFYTFQSLSYTIDVYKERMPATRALADYALCVSMFPQLLAGPIARVRTMLPQIQAPRRIEAAQLNAAVLLIVWGYFKKVVIADNIAITANQIFDHYTSYQGVDLLIGAFAFAIQIYADFSGYSDIARGIAKLMGFELMLNFRLPYCSLSPADFWSRWNISLSTWLRDYVYWPLAATKPIPMPGGRSLEIHAYRNMLLTMLLGGLWHGASWNFVLWGAYWGCLLVVFRLIEPEPVTKNIWKQRFAAARILPRMAVMFALTCCGWVLFRAETPEQIRYIFTHAGISCSDGTLSFMREAGFFSFPLLCAQVWQYRTGNLLAPLSVRPAWRVALLTFLIVAVFAFGVRDSSEFIYFQF
ncbi:MBOAT family protein [candidate division KSB1 bacterium]|nr:MBOAT family protein [candidate division KSB1 bacterium]